MLAASGLPSNLWAKAVLHSVWIRNRVPMRSLDENKTPYKKGTGKKPDFSHLYKWGSTVWVKKVGILKLDDKAKQGRFVGYDKESKGYRVYWPTKRKVSVERDIYFNKDESLQPNDTQIEGEWDIPVNLDTAEVDNKFSASPGQPKPADNDPNNNAEPSNPENEPEVQPEASNNTTERTTARRNSLKGLPQPDPIQYGHGK